MFCLRLSQKISAYSYPSRVEAEEQRYKKRPICPNSWEYAPHPLRPRSHGDWSHAETTDLLSARVSIKS
jgi:hypothetical protein